MSGSSSRHLLLLQLIPVLGRGDLESASVALVPDELHASLRLHTPTGEFPVTRDDLASWDLDFVDAWQAALANLEARSDGDRWVQVGRSLGIASYRARDANASARLLILPQVYAPFPEQGALVAIPTPDQLLVVGLADTASLGDVETLIAAAWMGFASSEHSLSDQVFWVDGAFVLHHVKVVQQGERTALLAPQSLTTALSDLPPRLPWEGIET